MCTTYCHASASLEDRLKNPSTTCFQVMQPINRSPLDFEPQSKKPSRWFLGLNHQIGAADFEVQTENPTTLVLRLNQETCTPHLLVHGADHTRRHLTFRSSGHRVPDLCLTIPGPLHRVSYSYLDPHRCPSCRTCYLHITKQSNMILHTKHGIKVKQLKHPRFKFKPRHVNDSSPIKPRYWLLSFSVWLALQVEQITIECWWISSTSCPRLSLAWSRVFSSEFCLSGPYNLQIWSLLLIEVLLFFHLYKNQLSC
jgi:hypothetical protein